MSKTADLRQLITAQMNTVDGETYFRRAADDAAFPYKVFDLNVNLSDLSRDDYELIVDIWDKAENTRAIDEIADELEDLFNAANLPQATILPTFFRESRLYVEDPDRDIKHAQLRFSVQNYALPSAQN